jgi:hypothetical protein
MKLILFETCDIEMWVINFSLGSHKDDTKFSNDLLRFNWKYTQQIPAYSWQFFSVSAREELTWNPDLECEEFL